MCGRLVAAEDVAGVYFLAHVVEGGVVAVGDDGVALALERLEVVHYAAAEEGGAVGERGLIDDYLGAFGLDALHDALDGRLAEVVGVRLHREAVDADDAAADGSTILVVLGVAVPSGALQHGVGDVILAGAVALHDSLDEILRHVGVVCQKLLRVLWQAVAAVAEGRVVVVGADAWVETYAVDDGARVKTFHLGVRVKLVEIAYTQGEIGVGEELHGFSLLHAHKETRDALVLK